MAMSVSDESSCWNVGMAEAIALSLTLLAMTANRRRPAAKALIPLPRQAR